MAVSQCLLITIACFDADSRLINTATQPFFSTKIAFLSRLADAGVAVLSPKIKPTKAFSKIIPRGMYLWIPKPFPGGLFLKRPRAPIVG